MQASAIACFDSCTRIEPNIPDDDMEVPREPYADGVRRSLGRLTPADGSSAAAAFTHPYGLVHAGGHALLVSGQDGGGLLRVDLDASSFDLIEQIEPPVVPVVSSKTGAEKDGAKAKKAREAESDADSGSLRGVAIDAAGCVHVADKHKNEVLHTCDGGKKKSRTKAPSSRREITSPGATARRDRTARSHGLPFFDATPAMRSLRR